MSTRVVLTTSPASYAGVEQLLGDLPVSVRRHPLQEYHVLSPESLDAALRTANRWEGVVLSSPRAARILARALERTGVVPLWRYFVTGEATARALGMLPLDVVEADPGDGTHGAAELLARRIIGEAVRGPLLHLAGEPHRSELAARLTDAAIPLDTLVVYRSEMVGEVELMAVLTRADLVVVGSPMVALAIAAQGDDALSAGYVATGATTAAACRDARLPLLAVADDHTAAGLAQAIRRALQTF